MIRTHHRYLLVLFIVSCAIRAAIFVFLMSKGDNCWFYPDSVQYETAAQQLTFGKGFTNPDGSPQFLRLPGYPLFLAANYKIFGVNIHTALWVQLFLAGFIPILIFLFACVLFPSSIMVAKIAGIIAALHAGFMIYASMIATETLSLIALLIFFIHFFSKKYRFNDYVISGILLGLASLIRPIGVYTLVVSLIIIFFRNGQRLYSDRAKHVIIFSCAWLITVSPWLMRNFLLTGAIFFHTLPGLHFLQYSAAYVLMERDQVSYGDVRPALLQEWDSAIHKQEIQNNVVLNEYEKCRIAEKIAFGYMVRYPWYTIKTSVVQMVKTCFSLYSSQVLLSDSGVWPEYTRTTSLLTKIKRFLNPYVKTPLLRWVIYWEIVSFMFLLCGFLLFLFQICYVATWRKQFFMVLPYIMMFVFITLAYGCARLRFPIEPFLIIFSGAGWVWILNHFFFKKNIS